jgi:hypothetical protein
LKSQDAAIPASDSQHRTDLDGAIIRQFL